MARMIDRNLRDRGSRTGDRGQTLLVGAIGLAVLFVTMALVLNSAIYGSSLASQGSASVSGGDTMLLQQSIERDVGYVMRRAAIAKPGDISGQESYIQGNTTTLSDRYNRYYASNDVLVSSLDVTTTPTDDFEDGLVIDQDGGDLEDPGIGTQTRVRNFTIHLTGNSGTGQIQFDDGTGTWTISISQSSGTEIQLEEPDGHTLACTVSSPPVRINVTRGTAGGEYCAALDFLERTDGDYTIAFANTAAFEGDYRMIVKDNSFSPSVTSSPIVYSTDVRVKAQSPSGNYENVITVAPGEPS